ncbi:hypothetical protein BWI17_18185 [Betaproteobacteria bacterium GR16-43]|nr:hypothetical protein BWI17_18185 [Betaproteobacteria bacterium GR16-43]
MNPSARATKDLCVVVLEDDPFQRKYMVEMVRRAGVRRIIESGEGSVAIDLIAEVSPEVDVAICDLHLDDMDGVEFIRRAYRLGVRDFIIVSSLGEDILASVERMVRSTGARVLGALSKPARAETILALLGAAGVKQIPALAAQDAAAFSAEDILAGLDHGEFEAHFQPKVRFDSGHVVGAEALARWRHPELGMIAPGQFIPEMESSGLLDILTLRMLEQAFSFQAASQVRGYDLSMAVNASASNLQDARFPGLLVDLARKHGVPPNRMTIEVTETAVADDGVAMLETLSRLRIRGFGLSIDDFGTGYATLELLHNMPFTELKIDRSFVRGAAGVPRTRTLLAAMVEMARGLHLQTVAEGFEDETESRMLHAMGCDVGQGFYVARPMAPAAFTTWLQDRSRSVTLAA